MHSLNPKNVPYTLYFHGHNMMLGLQIFVVTSFITRTHLGYFIKLRIYARDVYLRAAIHHHQDDD